VNVRGSCNHGRTLAGKQESINITDEIISLGSMSEKPKIQPDVTDFIQKTVESGQRWLESLAPSQRLPVFIGIVGGLASLIFGLTRFKRVYAVCDDGPLPYDVCENLVIERGFGLTDTHLSWVGLFSGFAIGLAITGLAVCCVVGWRWTKNAQSLDVD
jgi:hypothetical protein